MGHIQKPVSFLHIESSGWFSMSYKIVGAFGELLAQIGLMCLLVLLYCISKDVVKSCRVPDR